MTASTTPTTVSDFYLELYKPENRDELLAFINDPAGYLDSVRLAAGLTDAQKDVILGGEARILDTIISETGASPADLHPTVVVKTA